jgi:hypothetical protein
MTSTPLALASPTSERLLHDVRAVADAVDVDLARIGADPAEVWVVLETTPALGSGSASVRDAWLDAETGEVVLPEGDTAANAIVIREGKWRVISVLSGTPPASSGLYSWTEPRRHRTRGLPREDLYDPFASATRVLCRVEASGGAGVSFHDVSVLPEGWDNHVADAINAVPRLGDVLAPPTDAAAVERGKVLLTSPNPLVFARALAALAKAGAVDRETHEQLLGRERGYRRALVHYVTLRHADPGSAPWMMALIQEDLTGDPDQRRAAALGVTAAWLLAPGPMSASFADFSPTARPDLLPSHAKACDDAYVRQALTLLAPDL